MDLIVPDCLVLKIEEYHSCDETLDTTMYILYDKKENNFVIRGKRIESPTNKSCTYSYVCKSVKDLEYFISFVICKKNLWTYVLYSYDNLPPDSYDITYESFVEYDSEFYQISAYDKLAYNQKDIIKKLSMLKNVSNSY